MDICPHPILHAGAWHFIAAYYSDFSQAAAAWERSIEAARLAREKPTLALVTAYLGDRREAKRLLDDSLRICIELKDKRFLTQIALYLAELALMEEDIEAAEQQLHNILNYQGIIHKSIDETELSFVAARLATSQQQYHRAATLFGLAEQAHSQINHVIGGPMRALADDALATVQSALEPATFAEAFAAGQQLSLTDTVDFTTATLTLSEVR